MTLLWVWLACAVVWSIVVIWIWHSTSCPKCGERRWAITPQILRCRNCDWWDGRL